MNIKQHHLPYEKQSTINSQCNQINRQSTVNAITNMNELIGEVSSVLGMTIWTHRQSETRCTPTRTKQNKTMRSKAKFFSFGTSNNDVTLIGKNWCILKPCINGRNKRVKMQQKYIPFRSNNNDASLIRKESIST